MTKRALWREYLWLVWHLHHMTWLEFLGLTMHDRFLQLEECDALIKRHNEEAGVPRDDDD